MDNQRANPFLCLFSFSPPFRSRRFPSLIPPNPPFLHEDIDSIPLSLCYAWNPHWWRSGHCIWIPLKIAVGLTRSSRLQPIYINIPSLIVLDSCPVLPYVTVFML